jgi:hypothetical protein
MSAGYVSFGRKTKMKQIYLDTEQCHELELPYWEPSEPIWRSAALILGSKRQGYDSHHRGILEPLGDTPILIFRDETTAPGWYSVI